MGHLGPNLGAFVWFLESALEILEISRPIVGQWTINVPNGVGQLLENLAVRISSTFSGYQLQDYPWLYGFHNIEIEMRQCRRKQTFQQSRLLLLLFC